jgi:hypothetical protein
MANLPDKRPQAGRGTALLLRLAKSFWNFFADHSQAYGLARPLDIRPYVMATKTDEGQSFGCGPAATTSAAFAALFDLHHARVYAACPWACWAAPLTPRTPQRLRS